MFSALSSEKTWILDNKSGVSGGPLVALGYIFLALIADSEWFKFDPAAKEADFYVFRLKFRKKKNRIFLLWAMFFICFYNSGHKHSATFYWTDLSR